ncbi:MAG TPA: hypothetical protein VHZ81_15545 [Galbitalea sp.]|jgi:hypothetical protein|nr:hypothetical protein [Galbitalea sp.]
MTFYTAPTPATPEPAAPKRTSVIANPVFKLFAYLIAWFVFSASFTLFVEAISTVQGSCASGNTPYVIARPCSADVLDFIPWVIFTALIAVGIAVVFANGIGFQLRVWAWPLTFGILGAGFIGAGGGVGWGIGALFIVMALVPLVIELRASIQRVFLGSFNIFGQQFKESPKAQPSFSSRKMPNPPDAVKPKLGDWAVALLGFVIPLLAGYYVALLWVSALHASQG